MNNRANEFTLCGMYLETNPKPNNTYEKVAHVQEEMRDNWEVDLTFGEALDILKDFDVFVEPEDENEDEEYMRLPCLLMTMMNHLEELDNRVTELEEK